MKKVIYTLVMVMTLSNIYACGGKFSCTSKMGGVRCETLTSVYEKTLSGEIEKTPENYRYERSKEMEKKETTVDDKRLEDGKSVVSEIVRRLRYNEEIPLAREKKKISIWIAPWIDKDGDLHKPEMVYSEIDDEKWIIGEKETKTGEDMIKPLEVK